MRMNRKRPQPQARRADLRMKTIQQAIEQFLAEKRGSKQTIRSYRNGLNAFCESLRAGRPLEDGEQPVGQEILNESGEKRDVLDPETSDVAVLDESWMENFIECLQGLDRSAATESLYVTAATLFYRFLEAERLASPFMPALTRTVSERTRKTGRRRPKFPRDEIERLLDYAESLAAKSVEGAGAELKSEAARKTARQRERLRNLRDRAFILLLADTGLRVSEARSIKVGDIDFLEGRLSILGKGDNEDLVRVSERAMTALRDYLNAQDLKARREAVQEKENQKQSGEHRRRIQEKSLYVFVRHDRGAKNDAGRISSSTAWEDIVRARATEAVGEEASLQIHPHSFRHYFVTVVLLATNNIEKARRLARHKSIATTQKYTEIDPELDQDYHEIFNSRRRNKR